jgi:hypothetical protein
MEGKFGGVECESGGGTPGVTIGTASAGTRRQQVEAWNPATPRDTTSDRAWATVIPLKSGPVRMVGYAAGCRDLWHLAFVRAAAEGHGGVPKLWLLPAGSCTCLSKDSSPECQSRLAHELRRFLGSENAVAIALYQHPQSFGPALFGVENEIGRLMNDERCNGWTNKKKNALGRRERCELRRILNDLGVSRVSLEYPRLPSVSELSVLECVEH